ncbi:MAG: hypothetical protein ACLPV8_04540 [Steroidobacteraceae bacterium]
MATPADLRLLDLLERWLESLELHTKYSSLDDDSYWKIQPWSEHQRPNLWILNLAKQKTLALRAHVEERVKTGDARFSDALEMMAFLANLVGAEHLERFIPVAEAQNERPLTPAPSETTGRRAAVTATATREMPKFLAAKRASPPAGTAHVARTERKAAVPAKPAAKAPSKAPPKKPVPHPHPERAAASQEAREQVIADATRLVQWGRKWFELPELIARMADRPALPDVRRILKENKAAIEKKAGNT